jgi:prophage regulatory protein
MGDLLGAWELAELLGVSRQRAYVISRHRDFPAPVARLRMGDVWDRADVEEWIRHNRPQKD